MPQSGQLTVQSTDPCPGYANVNVFFTDAPQGIFQQQHSLDPDGSWGDTLTLVEGPPPGSYHLGARCISHPGGPNPIDYAPVPITITRGTFTASRTSMPQSGQLTVQSTDPCPGYDQVVFFLATQGASGSFQPNNLSVAADGSWGGTLTLVEGPPPGSYEIGARCISLRPSAPQPIDYAPVPITITGDGTPPTITATAAPVKNANGWNSTDVTVSYTCTDSGSGVNQAASSLTNDVLTASGTATGTCVDNAGNSASASYTAQIDKVGPTVSYAGNTGTYGLLQTVAITCTASDALSGVASSTCANASGPAWTFGAGPHTLSANATDRAGNTGAGSTTFTVNVSPAALTDLTKQFVQGSAKYQALKPVPKAAVDVLVTAACNFLLNIGPNTAPALKTQFINAYKAAVQGLVAPGWLTANQAATLKTLANAI